MHPSLLESCGWVQAIGGRVVAPQANTYKSGGAASLIDFFVVDQRIHEDVVKCEVCPSSVISKHHPVLLEIDGEACRKRMLRGEAPCDLLWTWR